MENTVFQCSATYLQISYQDERSFLSVTQHTCCIIFLGSFVMLAIIAVLLNNP